ncbi:NTPase [Candidatus Bipolaricaulota bacterium]|nr:NTPase [Candidatus Bipolaricaulota bacterium]
MKPTGKKIAVTGKPGCGKTTLCKRIADRSRDKTGGLITEEIKEAGKRIGFRLKDLSTGKTGLLSHVNKCSGPKVGKYSVCLDQLNSFAPKAINKGLRKKDLLIIDEIGPMELKSEEFVKTVEGSLKTNIPCLFTVHRRSSHQLVGKIKEKFQLIKLTRKNRGNIFEDIHKKIIEEI